MAKNAGPHIARCGSRHRTKNGLRGSHIVQPDPGSSPSRTMTLEAFADTLVPGERRFAGDRAIAGAAPGAGAVAAGAIELLETPATGVAESLDNYVQALNTHAAAYASEHGLDP